MKKKEKNRPAVYMCLSRFTGPGCLLNELLSVARPFETSCNTVNRGRQKEFLLAVNVSLQPLSSPAVFSFIGLVNNCW